MKKQKVCALFCIAAISMSLATPAKADDRYPSLNETEETLYEKENQEEYELPDDIVVDSNNQSQEQQTTEEGTDSTEISDDEITTDRNNTSDGFNSIPEPGASEEAAELAIPDNGWYTDSYGNTFFYKQGKNSEIVLWNWKMQMVLFMDTILIHRVSWHATSAMW